MIVGNPLDLTYRSVPGRLPASRCRPCSPIRTWTPCSAIYTPPLVSVRHDVAGTIAEVAEGAGKPVLAVTLGMDDGPLAPGTPVPAFAFPEPAVGGPRADRPLRRVASPPGGRGARPRRASTRTPPGRSSTTPSRSGPRAPCCRWRWPRSCSAPTASPSRRRAAVTSVEAAADGGRRARLPGGAEGGGLGAPGPVGERRRGSRPAGRGRAARRVPADVGRARHGDGRGDRAADGAGRGRDVRDRRGPSRVRPGRRRSASAGPSPTPSPTGPARSLPLTDLDAARARRRRPGPTTPWSPSAPTPAAVVDVLLRLGRLADDRARAAPGPAQPAPGLDRGRRGCCTPSCTSRRSTARPPAPIRNLAAG